MIGVSASLLAATLGIGGCASSPSADQSSASSGLAAECAAYKPLSDRKRDYDKVHADFNRIFPPYVFDGSFTTKRGVYYNGSEAERAYLMGEGPLPKSLDEPFNSIKPFTYDERRYISQQSEWDAKLAAVGKPDQFAEMATPLWPNITDPDLKGLLQDIADTVYVENSEAVDRAFIAADSKCGF